MKPGIIYRLDWQNFEGDYIRVDISDTSVQISDADTPQVRGLKPTGDPLSIKTINNAQDKFATFQAKQFNIEFRSEVSFNINTFAEGPDDRFLVVITINPGTVNKEIARGFLVTDDLEQLFQPDPTVCVLTGSDHLGLLKDLPLTDDDGNYLHGKFKISYFIAQCLKRTGLSLPIRIMNNIRVGSGIYNGNGAFLAPSNTIIIEPRNYFYPGQRIRVTNSASNNGDYTITASQVLAGDIGLVNDTLIGEAVNPITIEDLGSSAHLYDTIYLDALTFEASASVGEDCYTVLSKILGEDCIITQYNGAWWVTRRDEYDNNQKFIAEFDADGNFISIAEDTTLNRSIGREEYHKFIYADCLRNLTRPLGYVEETYNYNLPNEVICNLELTRSTGADPTAAANETIDGFPECWEFLREDTLPTNWDAPPSVGSIGLLRKRYERSYEKEKYLVVKPASGFRHYFKTESFPVQARDRVSFGFNYRLDTDTGTTAINMAHVRLVGNDGFVYDWKYSAVTGLSSWEKKLPTDTIFDDVWSDDVSGLDTTVWRTMQAESPDIPVSGYLTFRLYGDNVLQEVWFNGLTLGFSLLVNNSYQEFAGQAHKVEKPAPGYLSKREAEVFISDSPHPLFKGAMFIENDGAFWLVENYYSAAPLSLGLPTEAELINRFGWHQAQAVWNQYRRSLRKFTGTVHKLGENWPDIIHQFTLTDTHDDTNNRYFLLLSIDQNWRSCQTKCTFIECYHTDGKVYTDPWSFKYITQ